MIDALRQLNEQIRVKMNELADHVATGGCQSWDDYKSCVGRMEGFAETERMLLDLERAMESGEE